VGVIRAAGWALAAVLDRQPALRVADVADSGDEVRRASQRLVLEGLRADSQLDEERALGLYQRALQVDSGNPFAYLALARQCVERDEPELALEYVERARDLFAGDALYTRGAEVHLDGLRGAALSQSGESVPGGELLERAARDAPDVWGDGRLDADELR
jgi:tetratricopeptide (TPR) repeat protein